MFVFTFGDLFEIVLVALVVLVGVVGWIAGKAQAKREK